jgi:Zn-dependent protease with chaperone function
MKRERSQVLLAGFVASGTAIITATVATESSSDLRRLAQPGFWSQALPLLTIPVLGLILGAWLARFAFVLVRAAIAMRGLETSGLMPARLVSAVARTGAGAVRCIAGDVAIAFCTGAVRPEIVVSEGLVDQLSGAELDAVLLHEDHHARQREPMARAASESAADVLFFLPLARWWSRRRIETAELEADQAAVRRVGPRPVASALCTLGSAVRSQTSFAGVAGLRVAQLLGDPLPPRRPALGVIAVSLLGVPFVLLVAGCVVLDAARVLGY